jgi:hypothetical protein
MPIVTDNCFQVSDDGVVSRHKLVVANPAKISIQLILKFPKVRFIRMLVLPP